MSNYIVPFQSSNTAIQVYNPIPLPTKNFSKNKNAVTPGLNFCPIIKEPLDFGPMPTFQDIGSPLKFGNETLENLEKRTEWICRNSFPIPTTDLRMSLFMKRRYIPRKCFHPKREALHWVLRSSVLRDEIRRALHQKQPEPQTQEVKSMREETTIKQTLFRNNGNKRLCLGINRDGNNCRNNGKYNGYCYHHIGQDPGYIREMNGVASEIKEKKVIREIKF